MVGQQEQRTHYVKVNTKGDVENCTDLNSNELDKKPLNDDWEDDDDIPCLRYANPIMLFIALSVMFITIFCIIFYGTMNSRGLINIRLPETTTPDDIGNETITMATGVLEH